MHILSVMQLHLSKPLSMAGGVILIIASFLPYGYGEWAQGSPASITFDIVGHLSDTEYLRDFLATVTPSYGESAFLVGLVIAAFLLLFIGGIIALLKTGGGSVAGPAALIILTIIPLYLGSASDISSLGLGYFVGWIGAAVCVFAEWGRGGRKGASPAKDKPKEDKYSKYDQYYEESEDVRSNPLSDTE